MPSIKQSSTHSIVSRSTSRLAPLLLVLCAFLAAGSLAQNRSNASPAKDTAKTSARLIEATFHSTSLEREVRYRILLPEGYEHSNARYPVLYLLHGLYGSYKNWSSLTSIVQDSERYNLIIVMPDAGNSWYVNSVSEPRDRYEDFIVRDLISEVDAHYRTMASREARGVAGLSMGGYGSIKFGLKYPTLFSFAASMSGALNAPDDLDSRNPEFRAGLVKVFGPDGNPAREENDVFVLAAAADPARMPYFYLDCGESDSFLSTNRAFVALLQSRKFPYEYHEFPGAHEWKYWDHRLPYLLKLAAKHLASATTCASRKCHPGRKWRNSLLPRRG